MERTYHLGGSFAPPLTDADLAEYTELSNSHPDPHVKRIMKQMLAAVSTWRGMSKSSLSKPEEHAIKNFRGPTGDFVVPMIQRLHQDSKKALEEHLVSTEELEAFSKIVDKLQVDTHSRNGQKLLAWRGEVESALWNSLHPNENRADFLRRADANINMLACAERYSDHFNQLIPGLESEVEKIGTAEDDFQRALAPAIQKDGEGSKLVPYPTLENDRHRVAAGHLLWYMKELAAGREPCTTEQLVAG